MERQNAMLDAKNDFKKNKILAEHLKETTEENKKNYIKFYNEEFNRLKEEYKKKLSPKERAIYEMQFIGVDNPIKDYFAKKGIDRVGYFEKLKNEKKNYKDFFRSEINFDYEKVLRNINKYYLKQNGKEINFKDLDKSTKFFLHNLILWFFYVKQKVINGVSYTFQCLNPITFQKIEGNLNKGILVYGNTGVGKTSLIKAINSLTYQSTYSSKPVIPFEFNKKLFNFHWNDSISAIDIVNSDYEDNFKEKNNYIERLKNVPILFIDDLGAEQEKNKFKYHSQIIEDIIQYRSEGKYYTIITTNLSMDEIRERYGERFFSRICELNYYKIESTKDYRKLR